MHSLLTSNKEAAAVFDEQEWAAVPRVTVATVTVTAVAAAAVAAGMPDMQRRMPSRSKDSCPCCSSLRSSTTPTTAAAVVVCMCVCFVLVAKNYSMFSCCPVVVIPDRNWCV